MKLWDIFSYEVISCLIFCVVYLLNLINVKLKMNHIHARLILIHIHMMVKLNHIHMILVLIHIHMMHKVKHIHMTLILNCFHMMLIPIHFLMVFVLNQLHIIFILKNICNICSIFIFIHFKLACKSSLWTLHNVYRLQPDCATLIYKAFISVQFIIFMFSN